jgi:putative hydrolase of the HAD superfamily
MSSKPSACIFFDVDDTLYPPQRGLWDEISRRITLYIVERIGVREAEAELMRQRYFLTFGTTCNGLRQEYGVDPQDYYRFVHDIPLDRFLQTDPELRRMLTALPQRKFIFSNGDRAHILRVLTALGIEDRFDGIIDIFATDFACKPSEAAYRAAVRLAASAPAERCVLVDDLPRNLAPAKELGWITVLVHNRAADGSAHYQIDAIYRLPELLARIGVP